MPDITLVVRGLAEPGEAERLQTAIERIGEVQTANVDAEKGLLAVSYEGGEAELARIEEAVKDAGFEPEPSPGAKNAGG
ncbi:MAG: heavy-metal-associated domain-containing protein [Actinomycetota bacterium]|jgi:copper chaperone CopZ|nr:heavy-metal-associated domain-containing protein [Actinomycetota bacterium]